MSKQQVKRFWSKNKTVSDDLGLEIMMGNKHHNKLSNNKPDLSIGFNTTPVITHLPKRISFR